MSYLSVMPNPPGQALKNLFRRKGISVKEVVKKTGLSRATVSRHISGKRIPDMEDRRAYAKAIGVEFREVNAIWDTPALFESAGDRVGLSARVRVPLYDGVSAVEARHELEHAEELIAVSGDVQATFAVRIRGTCMEPIYEDGDIVIFSIPRFEAEEFVDGRDYWIQFADGQTTFKRVLVNREQPEHLTMYPVNPSYKPWSVHRSQVQRAARAVERKMR